MVQASGSSGWTEVWGPEEDDEVIAYRQRVQELRVSATRCFLRLGLPSTHPQLRQIMYKLQVGEKTVRRPCSPPPFSLECDTPG